MVDVRPRPCASCPYRRDVPSGLWEASEYEKLPRYDGSILEQAEANALDLFACHSTPATLCAGWVGCHEMHDNLAVRMAGQRVDPAVFEYASPVPLFESGTEAAAHGKRDLDCPGPGADAMREKLFRVVARRTGREVA